MIGWGMGAALAIADWRARTAAERRRREGERYDREVRSALARGWPDTAAAIEAERADWLAALDATANN